jgi:hypothetical protein
MVTDTRNSAAQAAANQKNQTPKPPAPVSPWKMSTSLQTQYATAVDVLQWLHVQMIFRGYLGWVC